MKWDRAWAVFMTLGIATALMPGACGGDDRPPTQGFPVPQRDVTQPPIETGTGGAGAGGQSGGGGVDAGPTSCAEIQCSGHSECDDTDGTARCVCDHGYRLDGASGECVVNEDCITIRLLEEGCRYVNNGPSGVAMFFAVDYCAGTAVLPEKLGDPTQLTQAFKITEQAPGEEPIDVRDLPESSATVIPREVESYVTIAIDVSDSVTDDPVLVSELTAELTSFIASLNKPDDPPVGVSVLVFGKIIAELVPFTTDLDKVVAAVASLETNTDAVVGLVDGQGTVLRRAVHEGIRRTDRIRKLRAAVTQGGVLTMGTLVVITDGGDPSGVELDPELLGSTQTNLISIGISNDITDDDLAAIGRDASFLAPTPESRTAAFDEVAQRIDQYPDRSYLLGYCSPKRTLINTMTIGLYRSGDITEASCTFDANVFTEDPTVRCNAALFTGECDSLDCGGLTACGACAADQCCALDPNTGSPFCSAPAKNDNCRGQDELCRPTNERCVAVTPGTGACAPPAALGDSCVTTPCEAGVGYCSGGVCVPTLLSGPNSEGEICAPIGGIPDGQKCDGLSCARVDPDSSVEPFLCTSAQMYDLCAGEDASAVCETGTTCRSNVCQPRDATKCTSHSDCLSGHCLGAACAPTGFCHFSWADKMDVTP